MKLESEKYIVESNNHCFTGFLCMIKRLKDNRYTDIFEGTDAKEIVEELEEAYKKDISLFNYFCSLYTYIKI